MSTPETDGLALAKSIGKHVLPVVMRNWADLVLSSEDPRVHKEFVEVVHKLDAKNENIGTQVNLTISLDGAPVFDIQTTEVPTPATDATIVDPAITTSADDLRPTDTLSLPPPTAEERAEVTSFLDLFDLKT
jgi:hypothetical protein